MKQASYLGEPYVSGLSQMLDDIEQGHVLVARFQRPLVWTIEKQLELLRSILKGLPIGGILLWRTRGQGLECYDRIGRHRIRKLGPNQGAIEQYVLDGFQRLSTLYSALRRDDADDVAQDADDGAEDVDGGQLPPRFYLNLDTNDFVSSLDEDTAPELLPTWVLMDRMELIRRERTFADERWIETAESVFLAFDRSEIPVSPLVTDDLEIALQGFERINSQVTKVGRLHAAHALSWSTRFDLLHETVQLKESVLAPLGWGRIEDDAVLGVCTLLLGLPLDGRQERVGKALRERPHVLKDAGSALSMAAGFLRERGIFRPDYVPYGKQIVLVSAALSPFREHASEEMLSAWLWLTAYSELFTGISGGRLQRVHEALQRAADSKKLTWPGWRPFKRRSLSGRFDLRSARAKALAIRLAELKPRLTPEAPPLDVERLQHESTVTEALCRILPKSRLPAAMFASAGNCFLIPPERATAFREELLQLTIDGLGASGEVIDSPETRAWLEGHGVSSRALEHLANGRLEAFVAQRGADLDALEERFLGPCLAMLGPTTDVLD